MNKFPGGIFLLCLAAVLLCGCGGTVEKISIIPAPQSVETGKGHFTLSDGVVMTQPSDSLLAFPWGYLRAHLARYADTSALPRDGQIEMTLDDRPDDGSYTLSVTPGKVVMTAGGYPGMMNAVASFRQMLPAEPQQRDAKSARRYEIPAVKIDDYPRFGWRGLHLDVSRHFFDREEIMRLLDVMAFYKFNKFHWHLTDDQGWRVEIKKYPLLTEKGAWREFNDQDMGCLAIARRDDNPDMMLPAKRIRRENGKTLYGGYYTQEDIRGIVAYAAKLGIDVIPELDMPGHSQRAIDAYPYLSCFGKPDWGHTFSSPLCPGKDSTIRFCKDVYAEIFELFPYGYVHLGADEVEKHNWEKCPDCRERIRAEKLDGEVGLQAWFVREMEKFFNDNGRTLMGWDEIADGPLSGTAVITWWRNWAPQNVRKAVGQGNYVVMSPNTEFYLDYAEDKYSVTNIYNFDPFRERTGTSAGREKYVLGLQGNLWTEWVPSWERLGYQYFPRAFAVSEAAWTMPGNRDEGDFNRRVLEHYARLDRFGMSYRPPFIEGYHDVNAFTDKTVVSIDYPLENMTIRYTADGSAPGMSSPVLPASLTLTETTDLTLRLFRPDGTPGDMTRYRFVKSGYAPAAAPGKELSRGLSAAWYAYRGSSCAGIDEAPFKESFITDGIRIPAGVKGDIGLVFDGYIDIPRDGIYTFWLNSDDGSILVIDGETVIDNDGAHSPRERTGQKALRKGLHEVHARYFDHNGGLLQMGIIDASGQKIPLDGKGWFSH